MNPVNNSYDDLRSSVYGKKMKRELDFGQAVKDYQDEYFTGLTDEEREEIRARIAQYLEENPIKSEKDKVMLLDYIKTLLKEYGFKGDINEFARTLAGPVEDIAGTDEKMEIVSKEKPAEAASQVETVVDATGNRYLVITTQNGMRMRFKISQETEISDLNDGQAKQQVNSPVGEGKFIVAYENNMGIEGDYTTSLNA